MNLSTKKNMMKNSVWAWFYIDFPKAVFSLPNLWRKKIPVESCSDGIFHPNKFIAWVVMSQKAQKWGLEWIGPILTKRCRKICWPPPPSLRFSNNRLHIRCIFVQTGSRTMLYVAPAIVNCWKGSSTSSRRKRFSLLKIGSRINRTPCSALW